jgi:predicted RNA-binding Zn-ribbon protein involved in translation (DUF1610 family)
MMSIVKWRKNSMKKMSRTLARASIIMAAIWFVLLFFATALSSIWLAVVGSIVMIASLLIKAFALKCPNCGHGGMVPQWTKSGTIHCPKCGKAVEYDI